VYSNIGWFSIAARLRYYNDAITNQYVSTSLVTNSLANFCPLSEISLLEHKYGEVFKQLLCFVVPINTSRCVSNFSIQLSCIQAISLVGDSQTNFSSSLIKSAIL